MTHSVNDYAADTLSLTLETLEEARERCETGEEKAAIDAARDEVVAARELVLERERPTPTQKLLRQLDARDQ